jgi:hypothetical protein
LSVTNGVGSFEIATLSSGQTFQVYGLLRHWTYEISIGVPGYWIYQGSFTYSKGAQEIEIHLEKKTAGAVDPSTIIEMEPRSTWPAWGGPQEVESDARGREGAGGQKMSLPQG